MRASSLTIKPKALASAAAAVKAGVDAKSSIQAIGGVRIIATRTGAKLVTGNSKLSVSVPISAKVVGKIDCVVSHVDLAKALRQFSGFGELALTLGEHEVELSAGNRTISLRTLRVEDCFPFPVMKGTLLLEADGATFAEALKRADRFACRDETRPVLCAVVIDWNDGLRLVATDSYRLAAISLHAKRKVRKARKPEQNQFAIGRKLADALPLLSGASKIAITRDGEQAFVQADGGVKLHGATLDACSFEELLPDAETSGGSGELEIGLNPDFLRDVVRTVRGSTTTIRLHSPLRPAMVEDDDDVFLLMPIRLNV